MKFSDQLPSSIRTPGKLSRIACLLTMLLATTIYAPIIWRMATNAYDFAVHTDVAVKIFEGRAPISPHFLLHAGIIALQQLLPIHFYTASALVVLLAVAVTAALVFKVFAASGTFQTAALLTVSILLVAPIPLLMPLDSKIYFGYVPINVYHNPTILVLKPLALLVFGFVFTKISENYSTHWKSLAACILATIACALAKPSYIIVIVPALFLAISVPQLRKSLNINTWFISLGIILPALCILAVQYWLTYSSEQLPGVYEGKSGIIFAPLRVISSISSWLLVKFLLSIAFPLAVLVGFFRHVLSHGRLLFAWLTFIIGTSYTYLLAESGPRMMHGNFIWSGIITLFILFFVSTEFLCKHVSGTGFKEHPQKRALILCAVIFILHILSGIIFYAAEYRAGDFCK